MFRYAKNVRLASFLSPCLSLALYGSLWLPLWLSLPLSDILWPSLAHYCSLISLYSPWLALRALARPSAPLPCWRTLFRSGKRYFRIFLTKVLSLKAKFPICFRAMPIHCILKISKFVCFVLIPMDWVPLSAICAGHNCLPTKHYIISDEITGQRLIVSQLPFCL